MNFLAHLALSGNNEELLIGNAIADFTRKKFYSNFPEGIQKGIYIHHFIDDFTDQHPLVKQMLEVWRPTQGKYAAVVNDIIMDHFLALDFKEYHQQGLENFASNAYASFRRHWELLPPKAQNTFHFMENGNWLLNYQYQIGMERSLAGMSRRAKNENRMAEAVVQLNRDKQFFKECFDGFYPELMEATAKQIR